ncbi:uncharacterized protein [Panulirus ornatus]|uniref:uncharacterized protein isoform X2 n=1 Tax=Panulirus ornatus TaxID=150431 RepID=UPI003A884359
MTEVELQMTDFRGKHDSEEQAISVEENNPSKTEEGFNEKVKKPRKIMHFSDGILEEFSTDEEDEDKQPDTMTLVDPKTLKWGSWMYYWMLYTGSSALAACDYVGEGLANLLGITSPKYQYEIDEHKRCEDEEREAKEQEEAQMAGWTTTAAASTADGIKHKIVASSAIHQSPSPSHNEEQTTSECLKSPDDQDWENKSILLADADDSAHWNRY